MFQRTYPTLYIVIYNICILHVTNSFNYAKYADTQLTSYYTYSGDINHFLVTFLIHRHKLHGYSPVVRQTFVKGRCWDVIRPDLNNI